MLNAVAILRAGSWSADDAISEITLDFDQRSRRRIALTTDDGRDVLLDLPRATAIRAGDAMQLRDGGVIAVRAANEALAEVSCSGAAELVRIAWHLGNRHLPVQLLGDRIRIRRDHVIEEMLTKLGATVAPVSGPFDPEGGAYGEGQVHDHAHRH